MPLTDFEYEHAYSEALIRLADDGHDVGKPFRDGGGTRYSTVDGKKLMDEAVLKLGWGHDIAEVILEGRKVLGTDETFPDRVPDDARRTFHS